MIVASLLFALMGVCVKLASTLRGGRDRPLPRPGRRADRCALLTRWRGGSLRTTVPAMHFWRSLTGVCALCLWFYAIGNLPLATAMTLNYMSSVWMALFLIGGAIALGGSRVDARLVCTVLAGFAGVAWCCSPTIERRPAPGGSRGPAVGRAGGDGLSAGHRPRPRRRTRLPDGVLLLARRRRGRRADHAADRRSARARPARPGAAAGHRRCWRRRHS